ncbi:cytochrome c3 family protein [Malonomonas rubra]|nr:cytochrome c3 family protein [Malonomonas rubra]
MRRKVKLLLIALSLCCSAAASAAITGDCVDCHTMHDSQDGSVIASGGPVGKLLTSDCVGCHSSTTSSTIVTVGSSRVPIVYNQAAPTKPLAGGNFHWVVENGDNHGHNVFGIVGQDSTLSMAPGGDPGFASLDNCAVCHAALEKGCESCHWPRHHATGDADGIAGQADGWYRFLGSAMDAADPTDTGTTAVGKPGVIGVEDADWEQNPSSIAHNVYKGATNYSDGDSYYPYENSIGSLCTGCHENFHNSMIVGPLGVWIRHPSDVVLPNSGEYADYTTYDPLAPVAKQTLDGSVPSTITHDSDVVTCLSCHRAHGSPYPDMLRWDYENECVSGGDAAACGCLVCHTAKDGI